MNTEVYFSGFLHVRVLFTGSHACAPLRVACTRRHPPAWEVHGYTIRPRRPVLTQVSAESLSGGLIVRFPSSQSA